MLTSAREHYRRQQRISVVGLTAARRARRGGAARVAATVAAAQLALARDAVASVPLMLEEQGVDPSTEGRVNTAAFGGVASDGRPLDTLIRQAEADWQFDMLVATQLADVGRIAASVATVNSPRAEGYTRMTNPGACSRCAVLAGRWYRYNEGFLRHPGCQCRHIPAGGEPLARAEGLIDDPDDYFQSLTPADQDRIFTKAGADAIRDGADINQVVNARRGAAGLTPAGGRLTMAEQQMLRAGRARGALERTDVYGRQVFITREGITRRGIAGQRLGRFTTEEAGPVTRITRRGPELRASRRQVSRAPRLMPESIYEVAEDRADAIRLLRRHGYIT